MQREKASAGVELPELVDDGLPPHAAPSRARTAIATTAADVAAGRRMTRVLSFIVS
jgi:hypothetical protein